MPTIKRTLICAGSGPEKTWRLLFSLGQWLRDFADLFDEKPCDRAERTLLQGDDSVWNAGRWQFNWQDFGPGARGWKRQYGSRKDREKGSSRHDTKPHLRGDGEHSRGGIVEPAGAKGPRIKRPERVFGRRQAPRFVHHPRKLDLASPGPRILCPRRDDT